MGRRGRSTWSFGAQGTSKLCLKPFPSVATLADKPAAFILCPQAHGLLTPPVRLVNRHLPEATVDTEILQLCSEGHEEQFEAGRIWAVENSGASPVVGLHGS